MLFATISRYVQKGAVIPSVSQMIRNNVVFWLHRSCLTCIEPAISTKHLSYQSFQLFGFDFMVDETFKVWLIEINGAPACAQSVQQPFFLWKSLSFNMFLQSALVSPFLSVTVGLFLFSILSFPGNSIQNYVKGLWMWPYPVSSPSTVAATPLLHRLHLTPPPLPQCSPPTLAPLPS